MAWVYDAEDFTYDDWAPYAVFENDHVLVIKSEGDYFFAFNTDPESDRWRPLPAQSGRSADRDTLRIVIGTLLDVGADYPENMRSQAPAEAGQRSVAFEDDTFRAYRLSHVLRNQMGAGIYEFEVRAGDGWQLIDDYDTLWGLAQQIVTDMLREGASHPSHGKHGPG